MTVAEEMSVAAVAGLLLVQDKISMTLLERRLLWGLLIASPEPQSVEQLRLCWPNSRNPDKHTIRKGVSCLRRTLGPHTVAIEHIPGQGYQIDNISAQRALVAIGAGT